MANQCVDPRERTKGRSLRGFECSLCIWCICLFLCIFAGSAAGSDPPFIYPPGDIYVRHGDDLEIFCTATGNYTAENLSFTVAGHPVKHEVYNKTTIRLFVEKPKESPRQIYYCKNNQSGEISLGTVYVASPPYEVTDFKCVSKNFELLNCSWTSPDTIINTNYSLAFSVNKNNRKVKECYANIVMNSLIRYCYWNTTSSPRYREQEEFYYFVLFASNVFGNRTQEFTIDHFAVVKPDPPMNLHCISESPHSVILQWTIPNNINHFLFEGIDHKIEYQIAKIDDTSFFRPVNTSSLPYKNKTYRFNLTGLPYAHQNYGIRVYIRSRRAKDDEFWSEYSHLAFTTASEIPQAPPQVIAGAFSQGSYETRRRLYIYWKQLEEYNEAGANFTYKVLITQGSHTYTYHPDRSKSLGYLSLENASLDAMDVRVYSTNEMGSSKNSSYLYVPAESDTKSLRLNLFTKLAYENGTYELSWAGPGHSIDNYTLFWCQHNTSNICNGRINFTVLEPMRNKHIVNLPRDYRYQFAISANKEHKSSGMIWAKCDISKDGIAMFDFPIRFDDHDAPGKRYVKLGWSMDCALKEGIINGYNITYCPVIKTTDTCDKSLGDPISFIINKPKQMEATIENLRPYTTYQFKMALITTYGLKTIENTTEYVTTLEDTPTEPRNVKITDVENDSFVVHWDLPLHLNGYISQIKYVIHYNDKNRSIKYEEISKEVQNSTIVQEHFEIKLQDLQGFTNYTVTLQACNEGINSCSNKTKPILLRTRIGPPSRMMIPTFKDNELYWVHPESPGGTVDMYQIKILRDAREEQVHNSTALTQHVTACEGTIVNVTYQVRAINFDQDVNHGAWTDSENVTIPFRSETDIPMLKFYGEWSKESPVLCQKGDSLLLIFTILGVLFVFGFGFGLLKFYKKIRKMGDIKPEFPKGLFIEKEIPKYPFIPSDIGEKPTSDEMLLLPNNKSTVSSSEIKNTMTENDNCGSSEHTDSTALSDGSRGPIDRQNSTSDESSHSSLNLEVEAAKSHLDSESHEERDSSNGDSDGSSESSPYLSNSVFKKNKTTGYVQPVVSPATGYVQAVPPPSKSSPEIPAAQPTTSSYVMAGLPPAIFTSGVLSPTGPRQPPPPSGYVRAEDVRMPMSFPKLGPSPTKTFGPDSLPTMPTLPPPKPSADSSYIQLQSLDSLPSRKMTLSNAVPFKPAASSGYVRPEDAVISKHLNNLMSGGQSGDEPAILDPTMSPDAYCRFSWSNDPANDNLHSLLANTPAINPSKN